MGKSGEEVIGVVEVYKSPDALLSAVEAGKRLIWLTAAAGGLVLYLVLFWIVKRTSAVMLEQRDRLIANETMVAIGEMASAVAHGLRNPLASIRSSAELALQDSAERSSRESLTDVVAQADRLEAWIRELLTGARPTSIELAPLDIVDVLEDCLDGFRGEFEKRGVELALTLSTASRQRIRKRDSQIKVILITAHGNVQIAVDAMKAGAYDYLNKLVALAELELLVAKALGQERLEGALSYYQQREAESGGVAALLGESTAMTSLKTRLRRMLDTEAGLSDDAPPAVLITGESGTGKELVARAIHFDGPRRSAPFVEVNCPTMPAHLMESELFGYERGAFTDAKGRRIGLAEAADGGTLFLDEIGDIDLTVQVKLLKLLENHIVRRLGSIRDRRVNIRIVAATNRDLESLVQNNSFRSDLYFRLRMASVELPPLRNRGTDVLMLAAHSLTTHGGRYGKQNLRFSTAAEQALGSYAWPGNVRELRNVIEHAVLLCDGDVIGTDALSLSPGLVTPRGPVSTAASESFVLPAEGVNLEALERTLIVQALDRVDWNVTRASELLGLSRDTLRYRTEKFAIARTVRD
jgi:DNA-binding NtrC family response regulator